MKKMELLQIVVQYGGGEHRTMDNVWGGTSPQYTYPI